jgi:hypothetical protein
VSPRAWVLLTVAALAVLALLLPPIAQPPQYHDFADQRSCGVLPNCLDTASNALFVLAGLPGLYILLGAIRRRAFADPREAWPYALFFLAVILVGFASGYYHLAPDNTRLAWDRAAIALAFMAWFSAVIGERVGLTTGLRSLPYLVGGGLGSVVWWHWSETQGMGDLRPYLFMQIVPILLTPLLLRLYPPRYSGGCDILAVVGLYLLALLFDLSDRPVFTLSDGLVSGHTLKHAIAALAALWVARYLHARRRI